ncbi:hypothetical protein Tco_0389212 [Tanacetum coccineum]
MVKAIMTMGMENMKESVPHDLPPTRFLGHLKEQIGSPYRTRETIHMIGNPEEIHNEKAQEDKGDITSKDGIDDLAVEDRDNLKIFANSNCQSKVRE